MVAGEDTMNGIPVLHVEGDCIARAWEEPRAIQRPWLRRARYSGISQLHALLC